MQKTVYQKPELRDANDNIIQQGAFGKNTALSNSTNDGWIDYVMNDLEALHDVVGETSPTLDGNGHVVEPANLAIGDEDGNRIKNSYLKLSGGKVTGIASFRTDLRMLDNQDNRWGGLYVPGTTSSVQYLSLYGGTRATGDARLNLYSVGNGKFELTGFSTDGSNAYTLTHDNSGNLKWRGNNVACGNYLPLAGGTLTGNISFSNNNAFRMVAGTHANGRIGICGGTDNSSACIQFYGPNWSDSNNKGAFSIRASTKTSFTDTNGKIIDLVGYPNGVLTWNNDPIPVFGNNAGGHNAIFRGKNFGSSVTVDQLEEISAGTFRDLFIGDYWVINNIRWVIAAFDYFLNTGNYNTETRTHHAVIVPAVGLASSSLNSTATTAGGYVGSDFYTGNNSNAGKANAISAVNSAFGASNVLAHDEYLINAVTNGRPSAGAWYRATVELMDEHMVYGSKMYEPASDGTNIPCMQTLSRTQFPLFALAPEYICYSNSNQWLRTIASSSKFVRLDDRGYPFARDANVATGIRPYFCLYKGA